MAKTKRKMWKKALCLIFAFLFSIESMAAVVSDNDGSAFITKAEFEALKKSFAEQIDNYNRSIDSKIDGAIASYLAGMVKKKEAETIIANMHATRTFVNDFRLTNDNRLGDYVQGLSAVCFEGCDNDAKWNDNSGYAKMRLLTFDTGNSAEPYTVSYGTNKDMFLLTKKSTWKDTYTIPINQMESIPYSAWAGYYFHHGNPPTSFTYSTPASFSIECVRTTFGAEDKSITTNLAGPVMTVNAQAFFVNLDEPKRENVLSFLAGSTVPNDTLYINIKNKKKIGNESTTVPIDRGWLRVRYNGSDYSTPATWMPSGAYKLKTYHHKYENIYKLSDFVIDSLSSSLSIPVKYFNGLPLFIASFDGEVEFKIKLENDGNETSQVAIKDKPFDNVVFARGIQLDSGGEWSVDGSAIFPTSFNSGIEYTFKFEVVKDKVYYIKVLPQTNNYVTKVDIIGDIINTPQ